MTKGRWHRVQDAKEDKQQAILNPQSPTFMQAKPQTIVSITSTYDGKYMCPFCLHIDRINAYLISRKKGYDRKLGHCPECGNNMMIKTLTAEMTPEQFAEFMYDYSGQGGWQKVKFKQFNQRLAEIGWLERFWLRYKALKGEGHNETYEEQLYRSQEEDARAQGLIK